MQSTISSMVSMSLLEGIGTDRTITHWCLKWYMHEDWEKCRWEVDGERITWPHSKSESHFDMKVGRGDDESDLGWMTGSWSGQRCAWSPGWTECVEGKARPAPCWAAAAVPSWPSGWGSGPGGAGSPAAGSGATGASPRLEEAGRKQHFSGALLLLLDCILGCPNELDYDKYGRAVKATI